MHTPVRNDNEKLMQDIKAVVSDAETILHATAGQAEGEIAVLRENLAERITQAKQRLFDAEKVILEKAKYAAKVTDEYVHENPWQSIMTAGGIGFMIGYLVSSRRH
jgi:ElaB/YqjD/DUF883 family membrane-anchored ribosome-binding protein